MFEITAIAMAIGCLVCFIAGQFYGDYRCGKKAQFMFNVYQKGFESYQEAIRHIITTKGMNYEAIEKEALAWTMDKQLGKLKEHMVKLAEGKQDEQEDDKGG